MPTKKSASTIAKITSVWPALAAGTSAGPVARAAGGRRRLEVEGEGDDQAHRRLPVVERRGAAAGHGLAGLVGGAPLQAPGPQVRVLAQGAGPRLAGEAGAERAARGCADVGGGP